MTSFGSVYKIQRSISAPVTHKITSAYAFKIIVMIVNREIKALPEKLYLKGFIFRVFIMGQSGSSANRNPVRTNDRWLYCPVCEKRWIVNFLNYSKQEKQPSWLHQQCGHWDSHQWEGFLYR